MSNPSLRNVMSHQSALPRHFQNVPSAYVQVGRMRRVPLLLSLHKYTFTYMSVCLSFFIFILLSLSLSSEASAKTCDGVQCAFEELVEKILQTPGLWESSVQSQGVRLDQGQPAGGGGGSCGGYCSVL